MRVLALETSCDETAAAIVDDGPRLFCHSISTQIAAHAPFGGVVPELASREHLLRLQHVITEVLKPLGGCFDTIDALAVTRGPGLVGPLLVGMQFIKGLALSRALPWIGVNHLEGHLSTALLLEQAPSYPHMALLVSGGHTQLYIVRSFGDYVLLGQTLDDAAGEAFDKIAKLLGLGYPGGPQIDAFAALGEANVSLPQALRQHKEQFDFSFSGLKTAVAHRLQATGIPQGQAFHDLCASVQKAIVDILLHKTFLAIKKYDMKQLVLAGGVAANKDLRENVLKEAASYGVEVFLPPSFLCTDNAAMIGAAAWMRLSKGEQSLYDLSAVSRWSLHEMTPMDKEK